MSSPEVAPFPRSFRECPHDGKTLACDNCLDESARRKIAGGSGDGTRDYYDRCAGQLHFAHKALAAAREAGADRKLIKTLEEWRDRVAYVGD